VGRYGDIEWDDDKDRVNREKHGLPLIAAAEIFADPDYVESITTRSHSTESRMIAVGQVSGRLLTCVYVWRGLMRRIISLRSASRKERRGYEEANQG
jgi:uncharacterized protein